MVNTILKEADLFCPNSVRINFTIYQIRKWAKRQFLKNSEKGAAAHPDV
ncbi:Aspartate aminotransferase [Levilactobacillus zymae]|uniref:Aspartate aminotransferase n=1 Tax=Levilactobacillus zymae TaxID=267363 RepID=A0A1Y6JYB3_9LACO|nr:Aspartate aminotransferase [Levilactobacillus zymae]